jgi:pimeloyl-ACP methyl ester carboxylesterase
MKTFKKLFIIITLFISSLALGQKSFKVEVVGKGEPVFFFPGFGCTGSLWNETVAEISKTKECHIFTFAGFGNVPSIESPWLATIKNEIIAYTKEKKLKKPTLVGHSLGGTLSYWLASAETNLFKKVIAIDALPCTAALMIPNYKGEPIPKDNPQSKAMLNMDDTSFKAMNRQSIAYMCKNKDKHTFINDMMNLADRKTYVHGYIEMLNLDLRNDVGHITIPVTILAASNPNLETVKKTYSDQFKNLPTVAIKYAENAAHFIMYDQPEWYINQLKNEL